jgi:hypothetical protein
LESLEDRCLLSVFTVTTVADGGPGSLRQAILDSNTHLGADVIAFNVGGGGVQTIQSTAALPEVTDPVVIDGTTQPGYAGSPLVVLNGNGFDGGVNGYGLLITAGDSTVRGLVINGFTGAGVRIAVRGHNLIAGNYLGTDVTGTEAVRGSFDVSNVGLFILSPGNTVGGTTDGDRNIISGHTGTGVLISGTFAFGNRILGNFVGTDVSGTRNLANGLNGVEVRGPNTMIGGLTAGARNVISGNSIAGVSLWDVGALVQGNYIGTDVNGTMAIGNGVGVDLFGGINTTIGGTAAAARNVISGNGSAGINTYFAGTFLNLKIQGNYIGTDVTGTRAMGGLTGVALNAPDMTLGGTVPGAGNLISGNTTYGVLIQTSGTVLQGNAVGTTAGGSSALGNTTGVSILSGSGNLIGGAAPGAGNLISGNTVGIDLIGPGNRVQGNRIGTDATGTRAVGNDTGVQTDARSLANTIGGVGAGNVISGNRDWGIILTSDRNVVQGNKVGTDITGTAAVANGGFDDVGGGMIVAESYCVIGGTAPGAGNVVSGNRSYGIAVGGIGNVVQGNFIGTDATGTQALGNSGIGIEVGAPRNIIGGTVPGAGNLISGNGIDGVGIGGDGNVVEGNKIGTDVTGTRALGNGRSGVFVDTAVGTVIGGTAPGAGNLISGNVGDGITASAFGSGGNTRIEGNLIGTNAAGTATLGNGANGVTVGTGFGNTVGGAGPGARNVISGNALAGVRIFNAFFVDGSQVEGNYIGTDVTGAVALGNQDGILIAGEAGGHVIGSQAAGAGNLISGNRRDGVRIENADAGGNIVQGNRIGTDATGARALGNGGAGVSFVSAANVVGGTEAGAANTIAFNGGAGVDVRGSSAVGNVIRGNAIRSNAGLGIDLGGDGVSANDPRDADSGPNQLQNYPVLALAIAVGVTRVTGTLNSSAGATFTLDFYASAAADPSGFGEGARHLGSAVVATDAGGNAFFQVVLVASTGPSEVVTATATDSAGNTSEFSRAVLAIQRPVAIDIKPGDTQNAIDLKSIGVVLVAVLTRVNFDAAAVDRTNLSRIRFGDVNGVARVSPVFSELADVDGDGDLDLVLFFSTTAIRATGALTATSTEAELTGVTTAGTPFRGTDTVQIVDRDLQPKKGLLRYLLRPLSAPRSDRPR